MPSASEPNAAPDLGAGGTSLEELRDAAALRATDPGERERLRKVLAEDLGNALRLIR